ncbi:MAG: serine/threonine-protein kinase [Bradymonadia bacterium]
MQPLPHTPAVTPHPLAGVLLPGTPWRVEGKIGSGSMGEVLLARHAVRGHHVALKLLHRDVAADPTSLARLRREALTTAQIGHPHIVDVYDFNVTDDGQHFVVMKWLKGDDLTRWIQEGPRPLIEVAQVMHQLCDALQAAHNVGVVHRDLKPENIRITERDGMPFAVILDFGLARRIHSGQSKLTLESGITGFQGTPGYAAPEQLEGDDVDARADQYALGVIGYELLSGAPPHGREHVVRLVTRQLEGRADPLSMHVDPLQVSPEVQAVIMRMFARQPADRFVDLATAWRAFQLAAFPPEATAEPSINEAITELFSPIPLTPPPQAEAEALVHTSARAQAASASSLVAAATSLHTPEIAPEAARRPPAWSWWLLAGLLACSVSVLLLEARSALQPLATTTPDRAREIPVSAYRLVTAVPQLEGVDVEPSVVHGQLRSLLPSFESCVASLDDKARRSELWWMGYADGTLRYAGGPGDPALHRCAAAAAHHRPLPSQQGVSVDSKVIWPVKLMPPGRLTSH